MRAVKSVTIDAERRVIITFLDGSTETLYPNLICCDAEALRDIIKELLEEKADAIVQTIENVTVATFEDGADEALIRKLLVSIEPIQEGSGDPSPENVRPISGRTGLSVARSGKNLLEWINQSATIRGVTFTVNADGSILCNGTATGGDASFYSKIAFPYDVPIKPGDYILSGCPVDGSNTTFILNETIYGKTDSGDGVTINATTAKPNIRVRVVIRDGYTADNLLFKPMLRLSSETDASFEPYKGNTYSVNWETEAGTVYGGSLDVITGMLIVNKKLCKIGDLTFTYNSQYGRFETTSLSSIIKLPPNNTTRLEGLASSIYTVGLPSNTGSNPINNTIAVVSDGKVYIRDERYDNAQDFITGVGEQTIMYPLAEPIEYQLSAQEITTLLGVNNIWADSGNILELEYVADTKLYIGESQSGTLGSGRQTISNPNLQPVSEKTVEGVTEAVKAETEQKQTQEETEDERGE